MLMGKRTPTGYSADVQIWLICGDRRIKLSHASSTFVVAAEAVNLPACDAQIEMTIDGDRYERPVSLPGGLSAERREATVFDRDGVAPF
jgi:hypothetical protein